MRLSIIVPVYNVEKYLAKCLVSLLNQDIASTAYEIIVINDGSTDGSYAIAQKYAEFNTNLILLKQENKGLSATRNRGVNEAKGKYIYFVDSDDFIAPNILKTLLNTLEENDLEILAFNLLKVDVDFEIKKNIQDVSNIKLSKLLMELLLLQIEDLIQDPVGLLFKKNFYLKQD